MSDSVRPQRWQPTRLRHPWDSPGKNTGVGCHFLLQCMKVKSLSRARLRATPWTAAHQAPESMWFSRQEYWSGVPLPSPAFVAGYIKQVWKTGTSVWCGRKNLSFRVQATEYWISAYTHQRSWRKFQFSILEQLGKMTWRVTMKIKQKNIWKPPHIVDA